MPSFNPRLRVGGDRDGGGLRRFCRYVSIHASAWEATQRGRKCSVTIWVSIHASAWEATLIGVSILDKIRVSIHASAWEATRGGCQCCLWRSCFNPRLRVGGERLHGVSKAAISVSIHASAWEATRPKRWLAWRPHVSIHASAWEATCPNPDACCPGHVSIHASAWEATISSGGFTLKRLVSIHASAWEATYVDTVNADAIDVSIHASAWEAIGGRKSRRIASVFQSTPPRGRRRLHVDDLAGWVMFQSTPPRGRRRCLSSLTRVSCRVSIHASAWEATKVKTRSRQSGTFQSTPPRGRRQAKEVQVLRLWCFNPRLRVGGDPWNPADGHDKSRFNPRLRVGGDGRRRTSAILSICFNPRLRVGGDL